MRRVHILGALLIAGIVVAVALRRYEDHTSRASVSAALAFIAKGRDALRASCGDDTFPSKRKAMDIGLPESDPKAYIQRAELQPASPTMVRLKVALTDIYGRPFFGLFPWKVIPQGSTVEYEFTCLAERKFSARFAASTVEPKHLPATLRGR